MTKLGVYVQVPFCASKCSFCNFSSRVERAAAFGPYVCTVEMEVERAAELEARGVPGELLHAPVDSIYMGGGTPTLLGEELLARLVAALRARFQILPEAEFTLETTPGSADEGLLRKLRELGVNRLSIGAQTFSERELAAVGRLHTVVETRELVRGAREAGFGNVSLDLIAGLPHQTSDSWFRTLESAVALQPEHLSLYLFEVDEKSRLGKEVLGEGSRYGAGAVPGEDFMAEAYETGRAFLWREGFEQYEISNFARHGFESHHNKKYWNLDPYLGFGAGAHSFDGLHRWANESDPAIYQQRIAEGDLPGAEWQELATEDQLEEFFFLGLRQREGVSLATAEGRWDRERVERWSPVIAQLTSEGWLEPHAGRVRLAEKALLVSNEIFQKFLRQPVEPGAVTGSETPVSLPAEN